MSDLIIYGIPESTYVRSCRMAAVEKGVPHKLDGSILGKESFSSPELLKIHPFGKIPAMVHGDVRLFEGSAICIYIDEAFEGRNLQPVNVPERAIHAQWISAFNSYFDTAFVREYATAHYYAGDEGPPQEVIDGVMPKLTRCLEVLEQALEGRDFLMGDEPMIADFLMIGAMHYLDMFPEGHDLLAKHTGAGNYYTRLFERPSYQAVVAG